MIFNGSALVHKMELSNLINNISECIGILQLNLNLADIEMNLKTFSAEEIQAVNERILHCLKKNKDDIELFRQCFSSVLKDVLLIS